jgi:hypothetical protein
MTVDEENGEKMKEEWIKENNTLDNYPFQLYSKARSTPIVNFDSVKPSRKHQTQQRGEEDKYNGLTLQRLKEIARTTGALGDEETIGQEVALNRLRDFMSMFMGE